MTKHTECTCPLRFAANRQALVLAFALVLLLIAVADAQTEPRPVRIGKWWKENCVILAEIADCHPPANGEGSGLVSLRAFGVLSGKFDSGRDAIVTVRVYGQIDFHGETLMYPPFLKRGEIVLMPLFWNREAARWEAGSAILPYMPFGSFHDLPDKLDDPAIESSLKAIREYRKPEREPWLHTKD
jgi:hypothetical protein